MPNTVPITATDLRRAVGDTRYWQAGNAERAAFVQWVTEGYQALHGPEARDGVVRVRAYSRTRDGQGGAGGCPYPRRAAGGRG